MKVCMHILVLTLKKVQKRLAKSFSLDFKFFYCPLLYPKVSLKRFPIISKNLLHEWL